MLSVINLLAVFTPISALQLLCVNASDDTLYAFPNLPEILEYHDMYKLFEINRLNAIFGNFNQFKKFNQY